jgi:hypothetical protein
MTDAKATEAVLAITKDPDNIINMSITALSQRFQLNKLDSNDKTTCLFFSYPFVMLLWDQLVVKQKESD